MSYPTPKIQTVGTRTYGWWYYTFPDYSTPIYCNPVGDNFLIDPWSDASLAPAGKTILVRQASARIWGVQSLNGGFLDLQIRQPNSDMAPELVVAFDGLMQQVTPHPDPGTPINAGDKLLVEYQAIQYSPSLCGFFNTSPSNARYMSFGLWYYYD